MEKVWSLNLIHFLDFYFAFLFLVGTWRRMGQYQNVARVVLAGPKRWPNLLKLVSDYRTIFWTWSMILPALLALALVTAQVLSSRFVFPSAGAGEHALTIERALELWPALFVILPLGLGMLGFDLYTLYDVDRFDRAELESKLDEAEYWLRSRTAHIVRAVSFGFVNPRRMVAAEVEKALVEVGDMLNLNLWWVAVQMTLRLAFALSLWLTWAIGSIQ